MSWRVVFNWRSLENAKSPGSLVVLEWRLKLALLVVRNSTQEVVIRAAKQISIERVLGNSLDFWSREIRILRRTPERTTLLVDSVITWTLVVLPKDITREIWGLVVALEIDLVRGTLQSLESMARVIGKRISLKSMA